MVCTGDARTISALVCTRDRGDGIVRTVQSLFASAHPDIRVTVIDQSSDDRTRFALTPFLSDARLRYIHSDTVGLGCAHNIGLAAATSDIVAITDDDCEVPPQWLDEILEVFQRHAAVTVAFCNVEPGPHDARAGFIPALCGRHSRLVRRIGDEPRMRVMGAGMAVRRDAIVALGGFDEQLGPGARFPSADDRDIAIRALLHGHQMYHTARVAVIHHGFRTWAEGRALAERDRLGIGAAYAKPLKCGRWEFLPVLFREVVAQLGCELLLDLRTHRRPRGRLTRLTALGRGLIGGILTPIDRSTLLFLATT